MRVLLSGGAKTDRILDGVWKKFKSSSDELFIVEYMQDIGDIFSRGDYFDKAVITEQSITNEYAISDEMELRQRINQFALECAARPKKYSYVFLTQDEKLANMIHEEILPIMNESSVVLKAPKYSVSFFVDLIKLDVKQLPAEIVYEPPAVIVEETIEDIEDPMEDVSLDPNVNVKDSSGDWDATILGNTTDEVGVTDKVVGLTDDEYDEDDVVAIPEDTTEAPVDENNGVFDELGGEPLENGYSLDDVTPTSFEEEGLGEFDIPLDTDVVEPIEKSADLPNYIKETNEIPSIDFIKHEEEPEPDFLPGFDDTNAINDEVYTDDNTAPIPDMFGESDYDNNVGVQQDTMVPPVNAEDLNPFSNDDYNNYEKPVEQNFEPSPDYDYSQEPAENVFNNSDYAQNGQYNDDTYQNQIDNGIYTNEAQPFNPNDYNNGNQGMPDADAMNMGMNPGMTMNPAQNQSRKQGLLSKLTGKVVPTPHINSSGMRNMGAEAANMDINRIKDELKPFAARGNSIVVTGCGGCGTSTIAFNLANIISQLGYTVLLVDMDTEGRTQSYISKSNYESMEPDGANLMSAVNSSNGINTHISVVKTAFHLLTMGLGTDTAPVEELIHKEKLARFVNLSKTSHNFVIYDIPFNDATGYLSELTYMCDNLVLVTDASNWGITKTMLSVCNIASDDMQDTVFNRAQLVFNKYRNLNRVLGNKVKTCVDITKVMDRKVLDLVGSDTGFHFEDLHIAGIINDDPAFEDGWFEEVQYSDTRKGQNIFLELIEHIVLKK